MSKFSLKSAYQPGGDQPTAIAQLTEGLESGLLHQTLLGVTGSGKTFTMANVIQNVQRPAIVMGHNKTLAAQLYGEFRSFFPRTQWNTLCLTMTTISRKPMYLPSDTFIEKDSAVNEHIERCACSRPRP